MIISPQIWASLEQPHPICTFLPSKAPMGPYGPLGVNMASKRSTRTSYNCYAMILMFISDDQL